VDDDHALVAQLEDAGWEELDRQHLDPEIEFYADTISGHVDGLIDMKAFILAVLQAYWEENGR
jgi:hypothetical protein